MRILHTADWHLGRIFYGTYLTEEQAYVLEGQFLQLLKDEKIDALVIAGDIFDRAVPPVESVELWDSMITRLAGEYKIPTLVIGGNHDGMERLEVGRSVMAEAGFYIAGKVRSALTPITLEDQWGKVTFYLMPFAEPRTVAEALALEGSRFDYQQAYAGWAEHLLTTAPPQGRSVAVAHAFVTGAVASRSERPLTIGGTESISASIFAPFTYTALGHLHGPQQAGNDRIRYSGSLLKYSFDEWKQNKSFTIVDIDGQGQVTTELIPVEARRDVQVLEGFFDDLMAGGKTAGQLEEDYIQVRLLDTAPVIDGLARLRSVYPHILALELTGRMEQNQGGAGDPVFANLSEQELFAQFAETVREEKLDPAEQAYIDSLWERLIKEG